MAKIDKVKEQVGYLKVIFGLLFATDLSMVAFLFNHYGAMSTIRLVLVFIGVVAVTISIYFINKEILAKIDEMEDLMQEIVLTAVFLIVFGGIGYTVYTTIKHFDSKLKHEA